MAANARYAVGSAVTSRLLNPTCLLSLLLAVEASNDTLDTLNNNYLGIFQPQNGYGYYRLRTLAAGSICVAGFNCIMILAAGIVSSDSEIAAKQAAQAV